MTWKGNNGGPQELNQRSLRLHWIDRVGRAERPFREDLERVLELLRIIPVLAHDAKAFLPDHVSHGLNWAWLNRVDAIVREAMVSAKAAPSRAAGMTGWARPG